MQETRDCTPYWYFPLRLGTSHGEVRDEPAKTLGLHFAYVVSLIINIMISDLRFLVLPLYCGAHFILERTGDDSFAFDEIRERGFCTIESQLDTIVRLRHVGQDH